MTDARSILVTGASTGIGRDAALALKTRGWRVFATARKPEDLAALAEAGCEALYLDYVDEASIHACADAVLERTGGRLDALFNNGAYGQVGAVEDLTTDVLRRQFETNVFGWHTLTRRIVPVMRAQGHGRIVQCSSILGFVAGKYRGAYVGSKFALEGLTDSLRIELCGSGVQVALIEPGPIATRFTQNALANFHATVDVEGSIHRDEYQSQLARMKGTRRPSRFKLGPEAVTAALLHALESSRPRLRYRVTVLTKAAAVMKRLLPARLMDRLIARNS
ncbi:SDR family oxidoreductase [Kaistia sp. MMO-174]|uniref:SDR family oxidoreductase n=1 Tax=Kaistia sp. MMO-174 TaxID=3081256 RepID=UPI001ACE61C0|nr:SDR family oxidoreductase [Hyphomicrobiales bacterium]